MKVVVVGSFGDMTSIIEACQKIKEEGHEIIAPTLGHLMASSVTARADSGGKGDTKETIKERAELMNEYFKRIGECDLVYVCNWKLGQEHVGVGTAIDIGYAVAKGKKIRFFVEPENSNLKSLKALLGD